MINFNAIPGLPDKVRFNIKLPENASGVLLKYKTTPWVEGDDTTTGLEIADLDSDSELHGDNKWSEHDINGEDELPVSSGTVIYVRAFPYKIAYNETIGENEIEVRVGGLALEIHGDQIAGAVAEDTVGTSAPVFYQMGGKTYQMFSALHGRYHAGANRAWH